MSYKILKTHQNFHCAELGECSELGSNCPAQVPLRHTHAAVDYIDEEPGLLLVQETHYKTGQLFPVCVGSERRGPDAEPLLLKCRHQQLPDQMEMYSVRCTLRAVCPCLKGKGFKISHDVAAVVENILFAFLI